MYLRNARDFFGIWCKGSIAVFGAAGIGSKPVIPIIYKIIVCVFSLDARLMWSNNTMIVCQVANLKIRV